MSKKERPGSYWRVLAQSDEGNRARRVGDRQVVSYGAKEQMSNNTWWLRIGEEDNLWITVRKDGTATFVVDGENPAHQVAELRKELAELRKAKPK